MGLYIPPLNSLLRIQFEFNNIFIFLFLRVLSCSLISWVDSLKWGVHYFLSLGGFLGWQSIHIVFLSLGWIPLSGEFVTSYLLVDSLSGEVSIYPSIQPLLISSSSLLTFQI